MNEISITVTISDRPYKLMVKENEEELFRIAAKKINDRIRTYAQNYDFKNHQDILAMISLQATYLNLHNEKINSFNNTVLQEKLSKLDTTLTEFIEDK